MCRDLLPRVCELKALIGDPSNTRAYFQDFDETIRTEPQKREVWQAREREFGRLDPDSWNFLKEEALPYLTARDALRGWAQLISILNQARAHNFLLDEGCKDVRFVPRAKKKGADTPDLAASAASSEVLCEVKSLQISQAEALRRATGGVISPALRLEHGFFSKLSCDLLKAKRQMECFKAGGDVRSIAFVVPDFDDYLGEYKERYFEQIDEFVANNPVPGVEVVLFNQRTAFHAFISLKNLRVVNEAAG